MILHKNVQLQYICLSIYLFLFACNHLADWNKIWHAQLGPVEDNFKIITFRITVFFCLAVSFFYSNCVNCLVEWNKIRIGKASNGARSSMVMSIAPTNLSNNSSTLSCLHYALKSSLV